MSSRQPGSQHKITPEFFTVLDKVARIKADCQVNITLHHRDHDNMLHASGSPVSWSPDCRPEHHGSDVRSAGDCSGQVRLSSSLSLPVIIISPHLRLYRWAQATVRNTELSDSALAGLGQAMGHLQHREMLFQVSNNN